jgi:fatty-acyl-CoA synthase
MNPSPIVSTMMSVPLSLNHVLERAGLLFANQTVVSRLPDKRYVQHTYQEIHQRTRRLAHALQKLGLQKGDRVATLCWNHHVHLECYFGIPAAGGVMHTLNLRLSPDEIAWIANDAKDRILIVDDVLLPLLNSFRHQCSFEHIIVVPFTGQPHLGPEPDYEAWIGAASCDDFQYASHDENDPVSMCYTSGTTGKPKGVVYSHRSTLLHTLVGCMGDYWALRSTDVVLPVTPMFHANSWGIPYGALMVGAKLVFPGPHLHPEDLLDLMQDTPPTLALGVPTIWMGLIQTYEASPPSRWKLPVGMRSLVGGAAVPESLIRAFDKHGIWIMQGWGMTETSPLCTVSYKTFEAAHATPDETYHRAALAGMPVPLVDLRIRGDDGADALWNGEQVGEIQVRGPFITGSYHQVPVQEDKFTQDGWLRTGDVASVDASGFVRITDRTKDLIKSGGEWISSVDLENALMAHPAIAEAAVIAIPDPKWSERPLACVVLKPQHTLDVQVLQAHLASRGFAKWQLPERYEVLAHIPRTSTGKFYKLKLREQFPA